MSAPCGAWLAGAAAVLMVLGAPACSPAPSSASPPWPSLADMESEVVQAITAAHEALQREPDSGKAWGELGDHYFAHELTAPAAQCYSRAEELDPESFLWPYRMGLCWMNERPELAAAPLERSLRSLDQYGPAHAHYAQVLVRLGRTEEAIGHFTRASQLQPDQPDAEVGLGSICLARGAFEEARQHLEEALARDDTYVQAHVAVAQVYLALGMEKRAQRHAELSRSLPTPSLQWDAFATPNVPPAGSRARTRFAKQLEVQGKSAEAEEQYRAALRCDPDYYGALKGLADFLVARGRPDEAIELLREAGHSNPSFERLQRDLAKLLGSRGESGPGDESEE